MTPAKEVVRLQSQVRYYAGIKTIATWLAVFVGTLVVAGIVLYTVGRFKSIEAIIGTVAGLFFALHARAYASSKVDEIEAVLSSE